MKVVMVTLQLPKWIDDFFRKDAEQRMASKSMVMREVLADYVKRKEAEETRETAKAA